MYPKRVARLRALFDKGRALFLFDFSIFLEAAEK
jgi:hypothetical protein